MFIILLGENDDRILLSRLYIGEGDPIIRGLEDHFRKKEWRTEVIVFTSSDQTLNKAFVQFFEELLVQIARGSARITIENSNVPSAPNLSRRELAICEAFLREILLCLPLLGINLESNTQSVDNSDDILLIRGKRIEARGMVTSDGFVVLIGSAIASEEAKSIPETIHRLRHALKAEGVVRDEGDDKLRFTVDYHFGSTSTASSVILGRSSNGRDAWKNSDGISLKTI